MITQTDVLIVGGGLVGLACAAFLAQHGVTSVLVERRAHTSAHPKARLVNVRSMELYRALGVEREILAAGEPNTGFALAGTLADEHEGWIPATADQAPSTAGLSPTQPYSCDQQHIEPILHHRAVELGAHLWFDTTVTGLHNTEDAVSATWTHRDGAGELRARYAVAADGADSRLRALLGIGHHGQAVPGTAISALFHADLRPALRDRQVGALLARRAEAFLFARGNEEDRSWQLGTHLRPDWDPNDLTGPILELIREATGLPDLTPAIEDIRTWSTGAYVTDSWRAGRVFFAGDAAHIMPPYGGFGGNTGVQDAHNLAWKLAAVCLGDAPDSLLDTYPAERAPIAELTVAQALLRSRKTPGQPEPPEQIETTSLALGFRYPTPEVSDFDPARPVEDPLRPSGRPGTRAAHVALRDGRSTLDLLDPTRFTLIGSPQAHAFLAPPPNTHLRPVARRELDSSQQHRWLAGYTGPQNDRATLIRPDGVIATRLD